MCLKYGPASEPLHISGVGMVWLRLTLAVSVALDSGFLLLIQVRREPRLSEGLSEQRQFFSFLCFHAFASCDQLCFMLDNRA